MGAGPEIVYFNKLPGDAAVAALRIILCGTRSRPQRERVQTVGDLNLRYLIRGTSSFIILLYLFGALQTLKGFAQVWSLGSG